MSAQKPGNLNEFQENNQQEDDFNFGGPNPNSFNNMSQPFQPANEPELLFFFYFFQSKLWSR